jgi:hypothetical protein
VKKKITSKAKRFKLFHTSLLSAKEPRKGKNVRTKKVEYKFIKVENFVG